jgi:hypothetical protein
MKWMLRRRLIGVVAGMLWVLHLVPSVSAGTHKDFPEKNSDVYMPVSLAVGTIRTPEFVTDSQLYDILIQVEKPLPFNQMACMMGVSDSPIDHCRSNDPLLRADWIVWNDGHIASKGSSPTEAGAKFTDKYIFKFLGYFSGEAGKGTSAQVCNPRHI